MKKIGEYFKGDFSADGAQKRREIGQIIAQDPDVQVFLKQEGLSFQDEIVIKSFSRLNEFVREKQRLASGQAPHIQGYEPKLSMNMNFIDVTYVPSSALEAKQEQQKRQALFRLMYLPSDLYQASFTSFDDQDTCRLAAYQAALDFIEDYAIAPKTFHRALYIYGPFGVGKTHLLGAIGNELAAMGHEVLAIHYPQFISHLKDNLKQHPNEDILELAKQAPILMIDDIGAEANSVWVRDEVMSILLQGRMDEKLPTFFTSNQDFAALEHHLAFTKNQTHEVIKAARLMERIRFLASPIAMQGRNRRHD